MKFLRKLNTRLHVFWLWLFNPKLNEVSPLEKLRIIPTEEDEALGGFVLHCALILSPFLHYRLVNQGWRFHVNDIRLGKFSVASVEHLGKNFFLHPNHDKLATLSTFEPKDIFWTIAHELAHVALGVDQDITFRQHVKEPWLLDQLAHNQEHSLLTKDFYWKLLNAIL